MRPVSTILMLLFLAVFLFSGWKLLGYYRSYHEGSEEYRELKEYAVENTEDTEGSTKEDGDSPDICPVKVDFEKLKKINPDVVGWLYIDSHINYPIVQGKDNQYYLHITFERNRNFSGAIFLDSQCEPDFTSDNSIVYGHNLKNGTMFARLKRYYDTEYRSDVDYKEHENIWIITPDRETEYKVFAVSRINGERDAKVYTIEFPTEDDYKDYLEQRVKRSMYRTHNEPDPEKRTLTLSTCTSTSAEGRLIVSAVMYQQTLAGE